MAHVGLLRDTVHVDARAAHDPQASPFCTMMMAATLSAVTSLCTSHLLARHCRRQHSITPASTHALLSMEAIRRDAAGTAQLTKLVDLRLRVHKVCCWTGTRWARNAGRAPIRRRCWEQTYAKRDHQRSPGGGTSLRGRQFGAVAEPGEVCRAALERVTTVLLSYEPRNLRTL